MYCVSQYCYGVPCTGNNKSNHNQPYLVNLWPSFLDQIGIWRVGFCGGRKTGEAGEKPLEQG